MSFGFAKYGTKVQAVTQYGTDVYADGPLSVPVAPTNLTATADGTDPQYVDLAWTASASAPVTGYKVFRALGGSGSYSQIGTTASTSYDDDTTAASTEYDYYVVAYNNAGDSEASNVDTITTGSAAWVPSDLGSKLVSEWDIWDSSKVTLNGSNVASVADLRSVVAMAQSTAADQPALLSAYMNSEDCAGYVRTSTEWTQTGAVSAYNAPTSLGIFFVVEMTAAYASGEFYLSHYGSSTIIEIFPTATGNIRFNTRAGPSATTVNLDTTFSSGTPVAFFVQIKADGTRELYKNGSVVTSTSSVAPDAGSTHTNTVIGARFNIATVPGSCSSIATPVVAITQELNTTEIGNFFDWANTKFGLY